MSRVSKILARCAPALLVLGMLLVAGCHRESTKNTVLTAAVKDQFDMTIQAYKSNQFELDGAVLSALDLGGHFAYLKEQGQLPKSVLLERSDDSKIHKRHLEYLARLVLDYHFTGYYDDKGQLRRIDPLGTKARQLEDYHAPIHTDSDSAPASGMHGGGGGPPGGGGM
ncbi:hypothetical protein ACYJW8_09355 [Frateuria aurantia]